MADSPLNNVEYSRDSETHSADEYIDLTHDPDILYQYIRDAYRKTEQDLTVDTDNPEAVNVHAKVEVFQSAIQYVEAFGIYLLSYIRDRENLITHLTETRAWEVEEFFESLKNESIEDWMDANDVNEDYRTVLENIFGYNYVESVDHPEKGELTDSDLAEHIESSVSYLDQELRSIGEFYVRFRDIYNSVKHGNRAIPKTENNFQITPRNSDRENSQDEVDVELNMNFVLFVCRNSDGEPYTAALPIDYLIEHTLTVVEKTHSLFTQIKEISQAVITEEPFDIPFFTYEESGDGDVETDWVVAQHPSGVLILPRIDEIEPLESEPLDLSFSARLELDDDTLLVRTSNEDEITDEHPISFSMKGKGIVGLTPQSKMKVNISFTPVDLDAKQYNELLKIQNQAKTDSIDYIQVIDEQSETEFEKATLRNFPFPDLVEFIDRELIEQLSLLQEITQRRIPAPIFPSEDQISMIEESIEADLSRDDAIEVVEELDRLGDDREHTEILVKKMSSQREVLDREFIDAPPGTMDIAVTEKTGEKHSEEIDKARFPTEIYNATFEDIVNWIEDLGDVQAILDKIPDDLSGPTETTPSVYIEYKKGEPGFWFTKHQLHFQVLSEEADSHPPIRCKLCGKLTQDLHHHLREDCSTLN